MPKIYQQLINSAKSNTVKTYSFLTITFVLLAILIFFAIRPTLITIFEINEKTKELQVTNDKLRSKNDMLAKIKKSMNTPKPEGTKGAVDFFRQETISGSDDALYFAANVDLIAKSSNVVLTGFSPQVLNEKQITDLSLATYQSINGKNISITIDAKTLPDVKTFMDLLLGYARINKITTFQLKQNDASSKYPFSVSIATYVFYEDSKKINTLNKTLN